MLREAIQKLSKHSFVYAAAEQLGRLAGFLLIPLYTDYLPKSDYGTRELAAITLALLSQMAGINIVTAMARFYFEDEDQDRRNRVVSTTILSVVGIAALVAVGMALASPWVVPAIPSDFPGLDRLFLIVLGIFLFQMAREVQIKFLQVEQRSVLFGVISVSKLICELGLQILFLVQFEWGLEGLFLGILGSEMLFATILSILCLPRVGIRFSPPIFRVLMGFSLPLIPNGVLQFCLHSADRYLLGWLDPGGADSVGLYGLAYKLGYMPNYLVLGPFLLIWYPFLFSAGDEEKQRTLLSRLTPYFMLLMTATAFAVAIFSKDIVHLMAGRPEYYEAWRAIPLVCLGYWIWALFQMVQTGFYIRKKTARLPWITGAAVVFNVAANLLLIPLYGYVGCAIATVATFAFLTFITRMFVERIFPTPMSWRRIFVPVASAVVLFWVCHGISGLEDWIWPPAAKLACYALWVAWIWGGGFFDAEERAATHELVSGFFRRRRAKKSGEA